MNAEIATEGALLQQIALSNGLVLKLYDYSRTVAGDRWRVCVVARIVIPLKILDETGPPEAWPGRKALADLLGDPVLFEQRLERNFIEARGKDRLVRELCDSFLTSVVGYVAHPRFALRYVLKQYRERSARRHWNPGETH